MEKLNLEKPNLKKFGLTMGVVLLIITFIIFIRHRHTIFYTSLLSGLFFAVAFIAPKLLKHVYIFWMHLAFVLGWINTRLILCILFYLVFTPIGIIIRVCGKDLLERKFDKEAETYWENKEKKELNISGYERQF